MRISHKYRFVFISKPRCASTYVRAVLDPFSDIKSSSQPPFHHHATAMELKEYFAASGWNWKDYFVFTTVRNPWEMIVSYYTFFKPDIHGLYSFEDKRDGFRYLPDQPAPFREWIYNAKTYHRLLYRNGELLRNVWVSGFSKLSLANTINDTNDMSLAHRIVKVEELEIELSNVLSGLGIIIGGTGYPQNTTKHNHYREYYDLETKRIVEEAFWSDIEYGQYKF